MGANEAMAQLQEVIGNKSARVAVIGLGHVGLPEASAFADAGFTVIGLDKDEEKVDAVKAGTVASTDVNGPRLAELTLEGRLIPTASPEMLESADAVIIAVPTLLTRHKNPDVRAIESVCEQLIAHHKLPFLVILESTGFPGITEDLIETYLDKAELRAGEDYFLACSPARIDPGNKEWPLTRIPKVVGGRDNNSLELAKSLYDQVVASVIPASSLKAAEMTKLLENSFRTVNIAFINQMDVICHEMGLDLWEIIGLASTKPFGYVPFYPGPGPGGTCIPVDPFYVAWKAREYEYRARFIELAGEVLDEMPEILIRRVYDMLNTAGKSIETSNILVLGVAYKKDTAEVSEAAANSLLPLLNKRGAHVTYHDPYVSAFKADGIALQSVDLTPDVVSNQDAVIVLTDHSEVDYSMVADNSELIFDTRNVVRTGNRQRARVFR